MIHKISQDLQCPLKEIPESNIMSARCVAVCTRYRGCKCPKDFYGPHCEFLKVPEKTQGILEESSPSSTSTTTNKSPHSPYLTAILVLLCVAFAMMVGSHARYKHKRRTKEVPQEIIFDHSGAMWNSVYKDSRLNGRHHSFDNRSQLHQQQNLRIIALFDEEHEVA